MEKALTADSWFDRLAELVKTLRSDRGCPWDRVQTPEKIKDYLLEEAYEVLDALEGGSPKEICSELGDLQFHIAFLAALFEEAGAFCLEDVVRGVVEKMIRRHPHVFAEAQVDTVADVKAQWREVKAAEASQQFQDAASRLEAVPAALPALMRAYRVKERAAAEGLARCDLERAVLEIERNLAEFSRASKGGRVEACEEALGDLLLAAAELGGHLGVHPETALHRSTGRFISRCRYVEQAFREQGRSVKSASDQELDRAWKACKGENG